MKKNKTKEIWVPCKFIRFNGAVLDFTSLYEVSSLGRVRSLNYNHTGKAKILCPCTIKGSSGSIFYQVHLCKDCKKYLLTIHRLVLSSFDPEGWKPGRIVNHKLERTPTSCINKLSNLEWVTQKENVNTEHCKELQSRALTNHPAKSKRVKVTDLSTGEVTEYPSAREADRLLGIPRNTVCFVIKNHKGYYKKLNLHFEYVM